jgi:hypothetical protein
MYGTVKGYFPDIDDNITVLAQIESRAGQRRACAARQRRGRLSIGHHLADESPGRAQRASVIVGKSSYRVWLVFPGLNGEGLID